MGCEARVTVHSITLYPEFHINREEISVLSSRQLKQKKRENLSQLRDTLTKSKPLHFNKKYFVILPGKEVHQYHKTHGAASYAQRLHPKLIEKIHEFVTEGTTQVQEVKRALKHYVQHSLCVDIKPGLTDRAYYPTSTDIHNHIYLAQRACQLSKLDQENLNLKIQKWKKASPNSSFYFRPYTESTNDSDTEQNEFDNTLIYVHQESWQQELMVKYGNTIYLMDATYKTTKYELALFFVAVKTNVGYTAIADYVLQSETAEQISEALHILSSWNPLWQPPHFMVDYSEAEIEAIQRTFPACKIYLCDFHREQAWERWVKDKKHGLSSEDGSICLIFSEMWLSHLLRQIVINPWTSTIT